ncbi:MAG: UxaA family hydrolase [Caldilineaceae bacterium]|nr:UxaA family hydrolase [Caldilineaceae bacterium]MDE0338940.1 UxaA family hydrolase [Caldilineaceae bacterium]
MAQAQDAPTASQLPFDDVARLPLPGDNVAIATRTLAAGTQIAFDGRVVTLDYTVMEGHRFAVASIPQGDPLLSWELPFGLATRAIAPGEYIRNAEMLDALGVRALDFELPTEPNFADHVQSYNLDEGSFQPGRQVARYSEDRHFEGYARPGGRGVGTRNMIILLGTSSRTGGFVKQLESRLAGVADRYPNIDGIVAVAHTEGGHDNPNNTEPVLRTLSGFITHANVGAVLCVDYGVEPVNNALLRNYLADNDYPLEAVPHAFLTLKSGFQTGLDQAEAIVLGWLDEVNAMPRTPQPLSELKLALQCGGSDAFSGISGNPLASWVARELVRYGGAANLAETDELIGAEPYIMLNVRDKGTAAEFLDTIERFQERVAWHGHSAAGNPSGGNKYRGLYNIVLKSIGAAMKRHPDVRLDHVISYSGPMKEPGYYFMDSPGNDLESIAGQVASGCNMIYFVTGNGSITNFPFVPTIKIVTTTRRYELLSRDMDVNAGLYLDGTPMDKLGADTLDLTVRAASGERTVGERAGHAQVQLWRDWRQTGPGRVEEISARPKPPGRAVPLRRASAAPSLDLSYPAFTTPDGPAADRIGLILPTSLCSGQIGQIAAARLNRRLAGGKGSTSSLRRFVALAHTEGCGFSGGHTGDLYVRTVLGYLRHPQAAETLLLEHGCEKTHNDYFRHELEENGMDLDRFGWASIQLDGGIDAVLEKVDAWFEQRLAATAPPEQTMANVSAVRIGLLSAGTPPPAISSQFGRLAAAVAAGGGTVVLPENTSLLSDNAFLEQCVGAGPHLPTLAYGQSLADADEREGLHVMETPTEHWAETLTGLGGVGVEAILAYVGSHPIEGHPLVPVLQVTTGACTAAQYADDMDAVLEGDPDSWPQSLAGLLTRTLAGEHQPRAMRAGNIDFQFTRGLLGVSL